MAKNDYLDEMQVRFANKRLKEFISQNCLSGKHELNLNLDDDKRVGLADYIVRRSLAYSHRTQIQIEVTLKANNIKGEVFATHYDTSIMQLMTWISFSMILRGINQIVAGELVEEESPNSVMNCLRFSSMISQVILTDLMGSGHDSGSFEVIDNVINNKVDSAYKKNQEQLLNLSRAGKDCKHIFAAILLDAFVKNSKDSIRFALDRWELSVADRRQFTDKLNSSLKEEDEKWIAFILFQAITKLDADIEDLYKDVLKIRSQIFKG